MCQNSVLSYVLIHGNLLYANTHMPVDTEWNFLTFFFIEKLNYFTGFIKQSPALEFLPLYSLESPTWFHIAVKCLHVEVNNCSYFIIQPFCLGFSRLCYLEMAWTFYAMDTQNSTKTYQVVKVCYFGKRASNTIFLANKGCHFVSRIHLMTGGEQSFSPDLLTRVLRAWRGNYNMNLRNTS